MNDRGPSLTLAGHLEELRRRLGISLAAFLVATILCWTQVERLIEWLQHPAGSWLPRFAYFSPTEPLVAYLKVAGLGGCLLAMPVLLWQLWAFVQSGLQWKERYYGLLFIWWGSAQFLAGAAFAYFGLLPVSLKVLLGIGRHVLEPMISIDRYLGFVTALVFWCGLIFELPVVLVVLAKVGVVTPEWLRQQRSYAILVLFIVAALATPTTDPVNLLLMALPLVVLYELSILITRFAMRNPSGGGRT